MIAGKNEKAREFLGDVFATVIATIGWLRAAWRSSGIESCSALFKAWVRSKFTQGGAQSIAFSWFIIPITIVYR